MFDFLKGGNGRKGDDKSQLLDGDAICRVLRYFPIGSKIQYYPEYRQNIMIDSVVIAYAINDDLVYSANSLACDSAQGKILFEEQNKKKQFDAIYNFHIVIPVCEQSENKLDYVRREELKLLGGLNPGNAVTLVARHKGENKVPLLETTVKKRTTLKEGYYANQQVAMLDVDLNTLMLTDKRALLRIETSLVAKIQFLHAGRDALAHCTMVDFSDRSLRLHVNKGPMPAPSDEVTIAFKLPGHNDVVLLYGNIYRREEKDVVVTLKGAIEEGKRHPLGPIEILRIKSNLLQHS